MPNLTSGPWEGVRNTLDPFDASPKWLQDARNCYIADPLGGSGMYARPGFEASVNTSMTSDGKGVYSHTDLDGNVFNFATCGGVLYRVSADFSTVTDVTPLSGGAGMISDIASRVFFTSFAGQLIISDGTTGPFVATNLSSTPITGTRIDLLGDGTTWSAFGQPQVYGGSLFFVLNTVTGQTGVRSDIVWSNPGDPATGYQQTNFDFRWTLEQTSSEPIYAICATNVALFYFRANSIGAITGTPGPDLQAAATHDAISVNVGAVEAATVALFGNKIFFCDQYGRPWMMPAGSAPVPIWLNMRSVVDRLHGASASVDVAISTAVIEPTMNLYLVAIASPVAGSGDPPQEISAFDAGTGVYLGQWTLQSPQTTFGPPSPMAFEAMGILTDSSGHPRLGVVGVGTIGASPDPIITSTFLWMQSALYGDDPTVWTDNGLVPDIYIETDKLGYSADNVLNVDRCAVVTLSSAACNVSVGSPNQAITVQGTPSPSPSQDGTYRLVVGAEIQGRGIPVKVAPVTADSQWVVEQISVAGVVSRADPMDP